MRVLHVHNRYRHDGGEDRVVESERRLLEAAGHSVIAVDESNPPSTVAAAGALLLSPWNPLSAARLERVVDEAAPDVAHVHNTWFSLSPSVVWSLSRHVPVVVTLHNYRLTCANAMLTRNDSPCELCVGRSPWPAVRYRCYRDSTAQSAFAAATIALNRRLDTWSSASSILVVSDFARDVMLRAGLPIDKVRVHPNFVHDPGGRTTLPSQSSTVLFVGRLSAEKGVRSLLDAWAALGATDLDLEIVGDGPDRDELQALGVAGVRFVGSVSGQDVMARMARARALVFPTRVYEGQPMVVTEALANGLPIIASENDNLRAIIGSAGEFGNTRDTNDFARLLGVLARGPRLDEMSDLARSRYLTSYTPDSALARLESGYRGVIEAKT